MVNRLVFLFLFLFGFSITANSQTNNNLVEINKVWDQFCLAFESLDYNLMANIHSKKLVRIDGGRNIIDYENYIKNYKTRFQETKSKKETKEISLRFFERISNDSTASERGIYQLTNNKNTSKEKTYYGQFHVILIKENGIWKILIDYDSNEANSINEKNYLQAFGLREYDKFIEN